MKLTALLAAGLLFATAVVSHSHVESQSEFSAGRTCLRHALPPLANSPRGGWRMAKRSAERAVGNWKRSEGKGNRIFEITSGGPYYDSLQNSTWVQTPELTMGP
ncbi:hypothetical protein GGR56DRAFT_684290 [Xylariaceae sp. FL0804]|nr:hypothetical protein GGR56DRAFT_684290 [Xylariaceae sp. FL0804]